MGGGAVSKSKEISWLYVGLITQASYYVLNYFFSVKTPAILFIALAIYSLQLIRLIYTSIEQTRPNKKRVLLAVVLTALQYRTCILIIYLFYKIF